MRRVAAVGGALGITGIPYRFIGGRRDACLPWFSILNSVSELILFCQWQWRAFDSHSTTIRSGGWWDPSRGCSARKRGAVTPRPDKRIQ